MTTPRKRVVSGMRPTGRLHIGHYFGALQNWVELQNARLQGEPEYECFYFIADWHALTSDYANTSQVAQNSIEIATDWLAAGLDPSKSTFFVQSQIPEHAELHLLLSMITPLGRLYSLPSYKEQLDNIKDKDLQTYGFLGYPVLQCADIVIYSQPGNELFVPVGEDQVSHVELSREIVRKFHMHNVVLDSEALTRPENAPAVMIIDSSFDPTRSGPNAERTSYSVEEIYELQAKIRERVSRVGLNNYLDGIQNFEYFKENHIAFRQYLKEALTEPQEKLTQTPRIPGLDGRKMSKSYGNAITLSESDEAIRARTKVMVTDPARKRRADPGNPDICPVYDWHKLFSSRETLDWAAQGCRTAGIGCIECKAAMAENLIKWIAPVRALRLDYEAHPDKVKKILAEGSAKARPIAQHTMKRVREAVFGPQSFEAGAGN